MKPHTYRVDVSKRAAANLKAISDYISKDSPERASAFVARLARAIDSLEELPHRYRVVQELGSRHKNVRMFPVDKYLIYYRVLDRENVVQIITIRHGARRRLRRI